ncbi:DUF1116 domain-containing protein [Hwanghaeella grinnelliae]|nr:DUF1116 domain-containing protein [Hwanghaeella grinnelliae]
MTSPKPATLQSYRQMLAVDPVLKRIARLSDLLDNLPDRTLFHAGPPFKSLKNLPAPILNASSAAAVQEGFADTLDAARSAVKSGDIHLCPAQDFGIVTPLAFVAGPSMYAVAVEDRAAPGQIVVSPLNDGPPSGCLRFGTANDAGRGLLDALCGEVGADLARGFSSSPANPLALLPLMSAAIGKGDDLHGQVAAANALLRPALGSDLSDASEDYLDQAGQFVLNVIMAACGLMLKAGNGVAGSEMVTASGGNGQEIGYQIANAPGDWITLPATRPVGPALPGKEKSTALPAIGDSAVIDALGFGAACLRFAPTLHDPLKPHIPDIYANAAAHDAYIGPHPKFSYPGLKLGLDLSQPRQCLGIMLGMVEETGTEGLIGRGVAPWPDA